jgi:hypothetical protein
MFIVRKKTCMGRDQEKEMGWAGARGCKVHIEV